MKLQTGLKNRSKCLLMLMLMAATVLSMGCSSPRSVGISIEKSGTPEYRMVHKQPGPPPHAPAHGYRKKFEYQYYPSANVYYDRSRNVYFHLSGGEWQMTVTLPSSIRLNVHEAVSLELQTDQPYVENAQHLKQVTYKGKGPKKKGRKWKR